MKRLTWAAAVAVCVFGLTGHSVLAVQITPNGMAESLWDVNNQEQNFSNLDQQTGAFTYSYDLSVPPGRNGMQPQLSLNYNSENLGEGSLVGYGWSLSMLSIDRVNSEGISSLYTGTTYSSALAGGEIVPNSIDGSGYGTYLPRVANPEYIKFERLSNGSWKATDARGTIYTFGASTDARLVDPSDATRIFSWYLESMVDQNGNGVEYTYTKVGNQVYPDTIAYTTYGSNDGIFAVDFTLEDRPDDVVSYSTGFQVTTSKRISQIDVTVNSTLRKKFDLDYDLGQNGYRSVLADVTTTAYDDSATATVLPPLSLTTTGDTWAWANNTVSGTAFTGADRTGLGGMRFADINGDGFVDALNSFQTYGDYPSDNRVDNILLNDHGVWTATTAWSLPVPFTYIRVFSNQQTPDDYCAQMVDVNGDGLPDEVYSNQVSWYDLNNNLYQDGVYLNTGSGWSLSGTWTLPVDLCNSNNDLGVRFVELNGDGLIDIVKAADFSTYQIKAVYMNNGAGWTQDTSWTVPLTFVAENGRESGTILADVNGDGLSDIVQSLEKDNDSNSQTWSSSTRYVEEHVYLNTGSGWTEDTNWEIPDDVTDWDFVFGTDWYSCEGCSANDYGVRMADINGDGLVDLLDFDDDDTDIQSVRGVVAFNTGSSWVVDKSPYPLYESLFSTCTSNELFTKLVILDANADGVDDLVANKASCLSSLYVVSLLSEGSSSAEQSGDYRVRQDFVTGIEMPTGGTIDIEYDIAGNFVNGSGDLLSPELPLSKTLVRSVTYGDGLGNESTTSFSYEGGELNYNSSTPEDRKFSGFQKITETRPDSSTVTRYYHQNNGSHSGSYEGTDSYERIGYQYREELRNASGNLMSVVTTPWNQVTLTGAAKFVSQALELTLLYDGDADHKDTATEYTFDAASGNLTQKLFLGAVTGNSDGTYADSGVDEITTTYAYATDSNGEIRNAVKIEEVAGHSATDQATLFYYDSLTYGSVSAGNITKSNAWITGATYATTEYAYNGYGLMTGLTDAEGSVTAYAYDTYPLQPITATNDLSQATTYDYDLATGKVSETIQPNGATATTSYDGFGRPLIMKQSPPGGGATLDTVAAYSYSDSSVPTSVHETAYLDGSTAVETYTYMDGLGRAIQTRKETETANHYTVHDTSYDDSGRVASISLAYDSTGTARTSMTTDADLLESYTYDSLGRVTAVTNAAGSTTSTYDQWVKIEADANGESKAYVSNARGLLAAVVEVLNSTNYTTYYTYNTLGNLTKYTDAAGNERNFTYDKLGRRTAAEDLHATSDTQFGSWSYTYDKVGNVLTTTDANGKVITNTYDDLHRLLTENDPATGSTDVTYTYDSSCTNGTGSLCLVTDINGVTTAYTYDALGRTATVAQTVDSTTRTTTNTYNRQGDITVIQHPNGTKQEFSFGTAGRISSVGWRDAGNTLHNLVSAVTYAPHGAVDTVTYANGVSTTYDYDEDELYRLYNKTTVLGASQFQDFTYTYDAVGNITALVDAPTIYAQVSHAMVYDDLHRLTQAAATSTDANLAGTRNYTYGILGNIATGPLGTYQYQSTTAGVFSNPHAVTQIASVNIAYDKNGNMTSDSIFANTWDFKNRLITSAKTGNTVSYLYDHNGTRVKKTDTTSGVATYYVDSSYEIEGGNTRHHVSAPGIGSIATVTTTTTTTTYAYHHTDHLGGTHVETDSSGALLQYMVYEPYGKVRYNYKAGSYGNDYTFTGKELDSETSLQYFGARYYSPLAGRFLSADPIFNEIGSTNFTDRWYGNWREATLERTVGDYDGQLEDSRMVTNNRRDALALLRYLSNPQHLNSYSYVMNNPYIYTDPTGETEYHITIPEGNIGFGGEVGAGWTFGFAMDGTYGVSATAHVGGLSGADASIGISVGYSNAETWSDTYGVDQYVGVGGKIIVGGGVTTNYSDGEYIGTDIGIGFGARTLPDVPVAFSGGTSKTVPLFQGSISGEAITLTIIQEVQKINKMVNYAKSWF